jgi:hypothetical protein
MKLLIYQSVSLSLSKAISIPGFDKLNLTNGKIHFLCTAKF